MRIFAVRYSGTMQRHRGRQYARRDPAHRLFTPRHRTTYKSHRTMQSRRTFTLIGAAVGAALAAAITLTMVWLVDSYRDRQREFEDKIVSALDEAVAAESEARRTKGRSIILIQTDTTDGFDTFQDMLANIPVEDIASIQVYKSGTAYTDAIRRIMATVPDSDSLSGFRTSNFLLTFYAMLRYRDISYPCSVTVETEARDTTGLNISMDSLQRFLDGFGPDVKITGSFTVTPDRDSVSRTLYSDSTVIERPWTFTRTILIGDTTPRIVCTVQIADPSRDFLHDMAGLIAGILAITAILCFSYIYLLHTVFRQKTLSEMRRDLTHNITHELKTPIATASAASEALLDYSADENPERRRRYLEIIRDQLASLSAMVGRILDTSLQERDDFTMKPSPCDLKDLLHRLCTELTVSTGGRASISEEYPENPVITEADAFHLSPALSNIMDNAVKYSTASPEITVRLRSTPADGSIRIDIQDNGIGIPASQRRRIFEKYYRIPTGDVQNVRGFGIGLYYTRLVVEKHGGSISVSEAAGGRGSVFSIVLPEHSGRLQSNTQDNNKQRHHEHSGQ